MPMLRLCGGTAEMEAPSSRISPESAERKPAIRLSIVVLPEPLGPNSDTNAPAGIASETWSTALAVPNALLSARNSTLAPLARAAGAAAGSSLSPFLRGEGRGEGQLSGDGAINCRDLAILRNHRVKCR